MTRNHWSLLLASLLLAVSMACSGVPGLPPRQEPTPTQPPVTRLPLPPGSGPAQPDGLEPAIVAHIIDGDTIELTDGRRVRYIGINTPEQEQPYYREATEANQQLVDGKNVQLEFDVETFDQYGRTLAYVWASGRLVNLEIVQQGYANAFTVPPNLRYDEIFRQAEREAREAERGLWAGSPVALKINHIEANAPGDDRQNPNGEWVEIVNQGREPVQMEGYTLSDLANKVYTFANFTAQPGVPFRVYSGQGQDTAEALYWGFVEESVWNNDADSAFLRDRDGALIDSLTY